ncbi:hypothetical protein N7510_004892 [Penicillium lagena]|uniref:uncharacterized protein n=1 Tax=Penicillium lagena TaxID=94218 RepID=UPI0025406AE5|nr:uncharacterized protein N7510_004892 [Penicillium lagena]KAJ5620908.1 hypothetical protein N7510_004892 [Penicillium lagena]
MRIAYLGTSVSNISQLVAHEAQFSKAQCSSLVFPFPSIRPVRPWKPSTDLPLIEWYRTSFEREISTLPDKELRDELIESFFEKVHPGFPVIDEAEFRTRYENSENPPPLLLLHAILLVGAHVSNHPRVTKSRSLMKLSLFRRAKSLFDIRYENDRLNLIQAALLFTWHLQGVDDVSANAYYWIGIACRIAFGLGMHRTTSYGTNAIRMPIHDQRIYRRVWWTIYQLDVLGSLHHGRPLSIDPDECDQLSLCAEDFIECNSRTNPKVDIDFCIQNAALCEIVGAIVKMSSPGSLRRFRDSPGSFRTTQANLDTRLVTWYLQLPSRLSDIHGKNSIFWALLLMAHYNLALLHLHRLADPTAGDMTGPPPNKSSDTCHVSAQALIGLLNTMVVKESIGQCWFTCQTMLLATALQTSLEARITARNGPAVLAIQAQSRLDQLMPIAESLSHYWPSAEAVWHLYQGLLKQLKRQTEAASGFNPAVYPAGSGSDKLDSILDIQEAFDDHTRDTLENNWAALFGAGYAEPFLDSQQDDIDGLLRMPLGFASNEQIGGTGRS